MSHFGRSGPPDITDTYSLLVLNITFRKLSLPLSLRFSIQFLLLRFLNPNPNPNFGSYFVGTTADDLFPLFDKYGKVVDIFIPKDRRYCIFSISLLFSLMGRFDYSIFDWKFRFLFFEGLGSRGVSRLCVTSMLMRLQRLLIGLMVCFFISSCLKFWLRIYFWLLILVKFFNFQEEWLMVVK